MNMTTQIDLPKFARLGKAIFDANVALRQAIEEKKKVVEYGEKLLRDSNSRPVTDDEIYYLVNQFSNDSGNEKVIATLPVIQKELQQAMSSKTTASASNSLISLADRFASKY